MKLTLSRPPPSKLLSVLAAVALSSCGLPKQIPSELHMTEKPGVVAALTPPSMRPVRLPAMPPAPVPRAAQEVFSVVVNDVSVKTLLFALARDNKLNVDIHPSISGRVTLNATDQTLPQLLERIAAQSDIRYEINGNLLRVQPDAPYLSHYTVDYVNLQRQSNSQVSISSAIGGTSGGSSDSSIRSSADNKFWETLVSNLCQIVLTSNQNRNQRDEQLERARAQERNDRLRVALELTKAMQPGGGQNATGAAASTGGLAASATSGAADMMRQVMGTLNSVTNAVQGNDTGASLSGGTNNAGGGNAGGGAGGAGAGASGAAGGGNGTNANGAGGNAGNNANNNNNNANPAAATVSCGASIGGGGGGSSGANNPLMVNKESGVLGVNTTSKGHEQVRAFLDRVMAGARRQVLIEATVVEVQLSAASQSGINWQQVVNSGRAQGLTIGVGPAGVGASGLSGINTASMLSLTYSNGTSNASSITSAIKLLESFGQTKVLSSPKLSVINNQTALIKVVDDFVYITVEYTPGQRAISASGGVTQLTPDAYTSKVHTIPVGFVMTVTPQISDAGEVTLNVRPSITRVISQITDPNPTLLNATTPIINKIPVIQSRELESILRVPSGEIAVLGGLMQESSISGSDGLPGTSSSSVPGGLLGQRSETRAKTELVVFMRPVVIRDASINGDYKEYKSQLPSSTFFNGTAAEAWGNKQ